MSANHYFDDPDEGISRETSHPRFRELAADDFFYDCTDDFSPFGNDDGADTLYNLEDWYREGGRDAKVASFLKNLIKEWDFGVPPKMLHADQAALEKWLAKEHMHEAYLQSICNAYIATAFGQLKVAGQVNAGMRADALAAIGCQVRLNQLARTSSPHWQHADQNLARLVTMRTVLEAA